MCLNLFVFTFLAYILLLSVDLLKFTPRTMITHRSSRGGRPAEQLVVESVSRKKSIQTHRIFSKPHFLKSEELKLWIIMSCRVSLVLFVTLTIVCIGYGDIYMLPATVLKGEWAVTLWRPCWIFIRAVWHFDLSDRV